LIYVVPHKASLAGVAAVEYFLGSYWGNKVYPSHDRSRGFPIVTSAYGPFLCTAKIKFNDGTESLTSRYIDFEIGNVAPRCNDAG
jgi:poly(A) polymerase Pap1